MANEITAQLNDEQLKKYEIMKENGMEIPVNKLDIKISKD